MFTLTFPIKYKKIWKKYEKWEKYDKCFGFQENLWKFKGFFGFMKENILGVDFRGCQGVLGVLGLWLFWAWVLWWFKNGKFLIESDKLRCDFMLLFIGSNYFVKLF